MWYSDILFSLRVLINDVDSTRYSDEQLAAFISIAAIQVTREVSLPTTYSVNVTEQLVTPDPSSDSDFVNLVTFKSACLVGRSELAANSRNGNYSVKLGPSSITSSFSRADVNLVEEGYCLEYKKRKLEYNASSTQNKNVILNPASSPYFDSGR